MASDSGWAIRRDGACLLTKEVDCGGTANGFRACCPSLSNCPSQYNVACCPPDRNCTATIAETPSCANSSWIMYDNGGYFCCEKGQVGYNLGNTDGCIESGESLPDGAYPLAVVDQISIRTSTSALASATALTTTKTTNYSPTSTPNTNNTAAHGGAIAGGVVGGVAGVAIIAGLFWFLRRKKGSRDSSASNIPLSRHEYKDERSRYAEYSAAPILNRAEMDGSPHAAELSTNIDMTQGRSEMP